MISIKFRQLHSVYAAGWLAAALALPSIATAQTAHSDAEIRVTARIAAINAIKGRFGRSTDPQVRRIDLGDYSGVDRRATGDGTYMIGRDRHEFTFECIVDTRRLMARGVKLHTDERRIDVRDAAIHAVMSEMETRRGRESEPRTDKVTVSDFSRDEKRVSGDGFFRTDGRQRTFTFECLVNETTGQVRRLKVEERQGRRERPGFGDRPGSSDREVAISDRRAREYAETSVLDRLRTDGVSGTV